MVTSTVETLSPTRVKLHISVTPDELKPAIAHAYEHIAQDVQIPGFRKGKVPSKLVEQRFGRPAIMQEAVNDALREVLDAGRLGRLTYSRVRLAHTEAADLHATIHETSRTAAQLNSGSDTIEMTSPVSTSSTMPAAARACGRARW